MKLIATVQHTKLIIIADNPENLLKGEENNVILVYPRGKRPSSAVLLRKNIKKIFSSYTRFPDINSLQIIRDIIFYLINTQEIKKGDRIKVIFQKRGEFHTLFFNTDELEYITIYELLKDRVRGDLIHGILKLCMSIAKSGVEGRPVGALFVVGDVRNVVRYIIQKSINPIDAIPDDKRYITDSENIDILRQYASMDGATIIDNNGRVISCGSYIRILDSSNASEEIGGRHLAAKSISKLTKAIAFVVSSEGKIRIYRDGHMIYQIESF